MSGKWPYIVKTLSWKVGFGSFFLQFSKAMLGKTFLVYSTSVVTHNLVVGDLELVEEQKKTIITSEDTGKLQGKIFSLKRKIGNRWIVRREEEGHEKEDSNMTQQEKNQFEVDWEETWKPAMKVDEVEKILE